MTDTTTTCPDGVWTQLTTADATNVTFQVIGGSGVHIKATTGAVAPASVAGAKRYEIGEGEMNRAIADFAPGIAGKRLYALATDGNARITVSHA